MRTLRVIAWCCALTLCSVQVALDNAVAARASVEARLLADAQEAQVSGGFRAASSFVFLKRSELWCFGPPYSVQSAIRSIHLKSEINARLVNCGCDDKDRMLIIPKPSLPSK